MGKEGKSSAYGKATKGIATERASISCKGKDTEKGVEEDRGRRGSTCGQATRSITEV